MGKLISSITHVKNHVICNQKWLSKRRFLLSILFDVRFVNGCWINVLSKAFHWKLSKWKYSLDYRNVCSDFDLSVSGNQTRRETDCNSMKFSVWHLKCSAILCWLFISVLFIYWEIMLAKFKNLYQPFHFRIHRTKTL